MANNTSRLEEHIPELRVLKKAPAKLRKALLDNGDKELIKCICECCLNILKGNVRLTPSERRKLRGHKRKIRALASRKLPLEKKRDILVQKGGFLPTLLGPVIIATASLLPHLVNLIKDA